MDGEEGPACKKARIDGDGADACASGDNAATSFAAPDAQMEMTASQVANMVAEMLAAVHQGTPGMDQMLKMCFSENVAVSTLSKRQQLVTGRDAVIEALVTGALVCKSKGMQQAEPIARIVAESVSSNGRNMNLSMAMDVYAKGASPFGVLAAQGGGNSLVVFRWVGDCGAGAKMMCGSKESLLNSTSWRDFAVVLRLSLPSQSASQYQVTFILNNYTKTEDKAGLGVGSETLSDTWSEEMLPESEEAIREAEIKRKQEQLTKSRAAFEKVTPHLENDKKIGKAAPIFLNMLKSEVSAETADAALKAARAAFGGGYLRPGLDGAREILKEAIEALIGNKAALLAGCSEKSSDVEALLEAWRLQHSVAQLLRTDDTFQYSKAGKELLHVLQTLPVPGEACAGDARALPPCMADAMMACLTVMEAKYSFAWARAPLDMCIKILVNPHKRKHFGDHQAKLEEIMNRLQKKKHGQTSEDAKLHYQAGFNKGKMGW